MLSRIKKIILNRSMEKNDINFEELKNMVSNGAIILDIRSEQEYKEGHLLGAICIPEYEIKSRYKNELKDKNAVIVVYCTNGRRSKKAQKRLERLGYTNVYNLKNGILRLQI